MTSCPASNSVLTSIIYEAINQPLGRYVFSSSKDETKNIPADLSLKIRECSDCGFAWNQAFSPERVDYTTLPVQKLHLIL